ncbi:MobB family relaxase [Flagellimonas pacifica]|uniref:Mobilization protein n=1 Tax=Flagellimonas pacifica TaxID=1247520 RepID=A0A285MUR0_9FLAO|nr:MobB family relaxase [Allomuricauda parva]SNY99546.1 hypothetical protein SAMN06265377_1357 [Allomuricauda parva]
MYITITRQHMGNTFSQSSADFVAYLEKENEGKHHELREPFFDQFNDRVDAKTLVQEIDANTDRLKRTEPKFYSITINPSQKELRAMNNDPALLRHYVREVMKDYAASFNREKPVTVDRIKYYAKIEHQRLYKGRDREIQENRKYKAEIAKLQNDIRKVERGESQGDSQKMQRRIERFFEKMPHKIDGKPIEEGMKKPGHQMHVHIVMSRKDVTNRHSLSPGSSYKASEADLNGKPEKRGFRRDEFFEKAEKTFDRTFGHQRNYVESYKGRNLLDKDPKAFFAQLIKLPTNERAAALKILGKAGAKVPLHNIPKSKVELAKKTLEQLKKGIDIAQKSSSIGV